MKISITYPSMQQYATAIERPRYDATTGMGQLTLRIKGATSRSGAMRLQLTNSEARTLAYNILLGLENE